MSRIHSLLVVAGLLSAAGCAARISRVPETSYSVFAIAQQVDRTRISGARVTLGADSCRTNDLGTCRIVLPPGTYPLRVEARGYGPYVSAVTVTTDVMLRVPLLPVVAR